MYTTILLIMNFLYFGAIAYNNINIRVVGNTFQTSRMFNNFFQLTLLNVIILTTLTCCVEPRSKKNLKEKDAEKFVELLKKNDQKGVYDLCYHSNYRDNITDESTRTMYVKSAYELIDKYGIPHKDKWIFHHDPNDKFDRYTITIPLFSGFDISNSLKSAEIIISFPPEQISDKIYRYEVKAEYDYKKQVF